MDGQNGRGGLGGRDATVLVVDALDGARGELNRTAGTRLAARTRPYPLDAGREKRGEGVQATSPVWTIEEAATLGKRSARPTCGPVISRIFKAVFADGRTRRFLSRVTIDRLIPT